DSTRSAGASPARGVFSVWPSANSLVRFGGKDNVLRSAAGKNAGPVIGIKELSFELRRKALVGEIGTIHFLMERPGTPLEIIRFWIVSAIRHRVPVPLGVRELAGNDRGISW